MDVESTIRTAFEQMQEVLNAKTVIGEPFEYQGRTIIPIVKIGFGFGAGAGGEGKSSGGGAGGGAGISPVAAIVIEEDSVRVLSLSDETKFGTAIAHMIENAPDLIEKCMEQCSKMMRGKTEEEEVEEGGEEGTSVEVA